MKVSFWNNKSLGKIEEQIAGNAEERTLMMPLRYIGSYRDKAEIEVSF